MEQGQLSIDAAYTLTQLDDDSIQTIVQQDKKTIKAKVKEIKQETKQSKSNKEELTEQTAMSEEAITLTRLSAQDIQSITIQYIEEANHDTGKEHAAHCTLSTLTLDQKKAVHDLLLSFVLE